jgi:hypothetical protein
MSAPALPISTSRRPYLYLMLVPIFSLVGWGVFILFVRRHLSESSIYKALDLSQYITLVGVVVLVGVPIRFRRSSSLVKLVTLSLFCGLVLAFVTFVGYMTVGFGRMSLTIGSSDRGVGSSVGQGGDR